MNSGWHGRGERIGRIEWNVPWWVFTDWVVEVVRLIWERALGEALFHDYEFAGNLGMEYGRQRNDFEQRVAEVLVEGTQRGRSSAESAQPYGVAVCLAHEIFCDR